MGLAFVIFGPPVLAFVLIVQVAHCQGKCDWADGCFVRCRPSGVFRGDLENQMGPMTGYNGIEAMGGILAIYAALAAGTLRGIIDHFRKHRNSLKYAGACGGLLALCRLASAIG